MAFSEKDLQNLVDTSMQYLKDIEGFDEKDTYIANKIMGMTILVLWINEIPLYHSKYPAVLRVLANTLDQIHEMRKKEDK